MTTVNQKDGVFNAVSSLVEITEEAVTLTKDHKLTLIGMLATALEEGTIEVSDQKREKCTEDKDWRDYASNILNNWTRKDLRLNGNQPYVTKNPGSRAGAGDEQVKELKKLKSTLSDPEQVAKVDAAIETRLATLQAERNKDKIQEVDFSIIPEFAHLQS